MTETLTPILTCPVNDTMCWRGSDFASKEDLVYELSDANVSALEEILERTRHIHRDDITIDDARHPNLDSDLRNVYEEVVRGRGLAIVRGFPVDRYSIEDCERLYWAFLVHFGVVLSSNSHGNKMIRVQQEVLDGKIQPARGTKSANELAMHNDSSDLFMLLCVFAPVSGGESQFSSGSAAHDDILREHPEILPILYRGFPHHRRGEQYDDQPAVTPYNVPIFANQDGKISINFTLSSIAPAMHALGRKITDDEERALSILASTLVRNHIEFTLRPGEASIANNYALCHSRSNYVDGPDINRRRTLLRAWTEVPPQDRRLPVGRDFFHMENHDGRLGYDKIPGRTGKVKENEMYGVDQDIADIILATQRRPRGDS